jgi:hypothetical protein
LPQPEKFVKLSGKHRNENSVQAVNCNSHVLGWNFSMATLHQNDPPPDAGPA